MARSVDKNPHWETGYLTQVKRDALALESIGHVDMGKIPMSDGEERYRNIVEVLTTLEDLAMSDKLTIWEYDFWESLNNQWIDGKDFSDKQYEKLLQISVKYE